LTFFVFFVCSVVTNLLEVIMSRLLCLSVVLTVAGTVRAQDPSKDEIARFKQYLEKNHKGKKWAVGPARLDSKELQKAYPDRRFYHVFTAMPLPPGAPLPELLERHRRAMEEYQKTALSLTVSIDRDGIRPLTNKVEDLSRGLIAVKSDDDAKTVAAAVLSIIPESGHSFGPSTLSADTVQVKKTEKGWTCEGRKQFVSGHAEFDADGKLKTATRSSMVPLPPSAPPRPR
jgi:hypothetical protein